MSNHATGSQSPNTLAATESTPDALTNGAPTTPSTPPAPPSAPESHDEGFPIIPEVDAKLLVRKLLETSIAMRAGVSVIASKSAGKSFSLERVVDDWDAEQMAKRLTDDAYQPQRVVHVGPIKSTHERDCLVTILTALRGGVAPNLRIRGGRKSDPLLLAELVNLCLTQNVVALVVEEGEFITPAGMTVLRDVMAEGARLDKRKTSTTTGGTERGIGILAVGSPPFRRIVDDNIERGHRWVLTEEIGLVPPALVPEVYLRWFPRFREHVERISESRWRLFIESTITLGGPIPVGLLIRHAQVYLEAARGLGPRVHRTEVPFAQAIFERLWHRPSDLQGANVTKAA